MPGFSVLKKYTPRWFNYALENNTFAYFQFMFKIREFPYVSEIYDKMCYKKCPHDEI